MKLTEHIYLAGSSCMGISHSGDCNVYAVASGDDICLIDCGLSSSPERLFANLEADGLNPNHIRGVLLTHVHPDHAGALPALQKMGIPAIGPAAAAEVYRTGIRDYYRLEQIPPSGFRDFFCRTPSGTMDRILAPGEAFCVGNLRLEMIPAPGHSPDSVCYLLKIGEKKHLFTGDTLFYPGQISCFSSLLSDPAVYPDTLRRLAALRPDGLYPGHALFTVDRAWECTNRALEYVNNGNLPPQKSYS